MFMSNVKEKAIYFSGLNGLRAIAAVAVVVSHITLALDEFGLNPHIFGNLKDGKPIGLFLGGYGVSIFFTLSGFLITYLLQAEKALHQVDIKKFYVRRILRIWPLYYAYLIFAVATIFIFKLDFNNNSLLLYVFYSANVPFILGTALPFLNHYWSLGVEEQFYLFWPWIISKVKRKLVPVILVMIIVLMGAKLLFYIINPQSIIANVLIVTRFHCMMIGGLAAILYKQRHGLFLRLADNKITMGICWAVIALAAVNRFQLASIIDNEIISTITVPLIIGQINIKNRLINLENRLCRFLGKISYGIYVIHPLAIFYCSKLLAGVHLPSPYKYVVVYAFILAVTISIAWLSYEYFEKYFLKLKTKYTVVKSTGSGHDELSSPAVQHTVV